MQHRTAVECANLLVLSPDRRPEVLVRRQADAFEIIVALAAATPRGKGGFGPKESSYMIIRQPPIYPHMAEGERFFGAEAVYPHHGCRTAPHPGRRVPYHGIVSHKNDI